MFRSLPRRKAGIVLKAFIRLLRKITRMKECLSAWNTKGETLPLPCLMSVSWVLLLASALRCGEYEPRLRHRQPTAVSVCCRNMRGASPLTTIHEPPKLLRSIVVAPLAGSLPDTYYEQNGS